jgi:hypothetical protein
MEAPQKNNNKKTTLCFSYATSGCIPTGTKGRYSTGTRVYHGIIHSSQAIGSAQVTVSRRMDKESVLRVRTRTCVNGVLFSCEDEQNRVCREMGGTGDHQGKWSKPDSERHITHVFSRVEPRFLKR